VTCVGGRAIVWRCKKQNRRHYTQTRCLSLCRLRREMREGRNRPSVSPPKFGVAWIPLGVARLPGLVIGAQQHMDWTPYFQPQVCRVCGSIFPFIFVSRIHNEYPCKISSTSASSLSSCISTSFSSFSTLTRKWSKKDRALAWPWAVMVAIPTSCTKRALSKLTVTDGVTPGVLWWLVACMYGLGFKMESCGGFDLQKG
jgi:hypothetical protein